MKKKITKRQLIYGIYIAISFMVLGVFLIEQGNNSKNGLNDKKDRMEATIKPTENAEKKVTDIRENMGDLYLRIPKNKKDIHKVQIRDNYMEKQLELTIMDSQNMDFDCKNITEEKGVIVNSIKTDDKEAVVKSFDVKEKGENTIITFTLDRIYVQSVYEDEDAIYIDLRDPKEVYPHVIVIDAGHGKRDSGSYTEEYSVQEKDLNLSMVLALKEKFDKEDIKVYYTRLEDSRVTLTQRVELANELNADLFISVHCNFCKESASPWGIEVLYSETHEEGVLSSKEFAQICLDNMVQATNRNNRGLVEGDGIHIIRNSLVPVALVETGFLSNWDDLQYLRNDDTRAIMVEGIYNGIKNSLQALEQKGYRSSN